VSVVTERTRCGDHIMVMPSRSTPTTSAALPAALVRRWLVVVAVGLGVGIATSVLQKYLDAPWSSLVNAASPWLAPAFAVGVMWRRVSLAAMAGLLTCLLELVGYYVSAVARGYSASPTELWFWGVCAVVGGPALGAAGWAWWRGPHRLRGLGAAVLAAAFIAEAAVAYGWRLHYVGSAILFGAIGVAAVALLGLHQHQHRRMAAWLTVVLPVGVVAELLLGLAYRQSF
jgi:Family of unknown function (DUF6518)